MSVHRSHHRGARPAPLTGRDEEQRLLDDLLADVREGLSGALLLVGEPGIGKTRLLDHAAAASTDLRVLQIAGAQAEKHLGFAGLHRLLRPVLSDADSLPVPQRDALRSAFGLAPGVPADRYLVGMATLTLLAGVAAARPLVCLVDDAQWLDRESAEALAFAARRLLADSVGLVFAARSDPEPGHFGGLASMTVTGLSGLDSRALLSAVATGRVDEAVAARIATETGGNPLALTELAAVLSAEQLAGIVPLPSALPVGPLLERHFHDQVGALPADTQALLLLLSAAPPDDPAVLWSAAGRLGIAARAAEPALAAGIIVRSRTIDFRHPLIRSAVYLGAGPTERRRIHEAIAAASDAERHPDRRAWHRAEATLGLDEEVAVELEAASERARSRGGYAEQAAFLARAADLSPEPGAEAARCVAAARAYLVVGDPVAAQAMLERAEPGLDHALLKAQSRQARAAVDLYFNRIVTTPAMLMASAGSIAGQDPRLARRMMFEAIETILIAGDRSIGLSLDDLARAVLASPAMESAETAYQDLFLRAFAIRTAVGYAEAVPWLRQALETVLTCQDLVEAGLPLMVVCSMATNSLWDDELAWKTRKRLEAHDRATGALGALQTTVSIGATLEIWAGRFDAAEALLATSVDIAAMIGVPRMEEGMQLEVMVWRGDEAGARAVVAAAEPVWAEHIEGSSFADHILSCQAVLELSLGRYQEALACVLPAFERDMPTVAPRSVQDVVEAAVRSGDHRTAKAALARMEERAPIAGTAWALGQLARCRALMADDEQAEAFYRESVEQLGRTRMVAELARTHLLYGEWLRRQGRRSEARAELRKAYEMFAEMGASAFAERARAELAATGERPRRRSAPAGIVLTPQESQVAALAVSGATNSEIAVRLFITTSTVEYHLNKIFRKLNITSRRRLADALRLHGPDALRAQGSDAPRAQGSEAGVS